MCLLKIFLFLKYLQTISFSFYKRYFIKIVLEKRFWGAHTMWIESKNIWYSFWAKVFAIPYRMLAVGFEPTVSCLLLSTRSNNWAVWPNDEMCLMVYRIKWPHKAQVIAVIYMIYLYVLYYRYICTVRKSRHNNHKVMYS